MAFWSFSELGKRAKKIRRDLFCPKAQPNGNGSTWRRLRQNALHMDDLKAQP